MKRMKSVQLSAGAALALALAAGCASSDRMARMSGGVVSEYSAPSKLRMRSAKFQAKTSALESPRHASRAALSGIDGSPVNVWPLFFSAPEYWSVLWPMIDCDPYGFAVRPFVNVEGDDRSILFPLSAWNIADKDGWALNCIWSKDSFGFVPLSWQQETDESFWCYYTPLFYHSHGKLPLGWRADADNSLGGSMNWRRNDGFTWFCLGYYEHESVLRKGGWDWLFDWSDEKILNVAPYKLAGTDYRIPTDRQGIGRLQSEVAPTLARDDNRTCGFFPLFSLTTEDSGDFLFSGLVNLFSAEATDGSMEWDFLGRLGARYRHSPRKQPWKRYAPDQVTSFDSWTLLFSSYKRRVWIRETDTIRDLMTLDDLSGNLLYGHKGYEEILPEVREILSRLAPGTEIPATVGNRYALSLWLEDWMAQWTAGRTFPTEESVKWGCLPLFQREVSPDASKWHSLAALSGYQRRKTEGAFWSVPLLSGASWGKDGGFTTVLTPLCWYSRTNLRERTRRPIYASDRKWAEDGDCSATQDDYALCGLYYHGKDTFSVAKSGVDAELAEQVRHRIGDLHSSFGSLSYSRDQRQQKKRLADEWIPKAGDRIDDLKKQIRMEELRLEEEAWNKKWSEYQRNVETLRADCAKLGFTLPPDALESEAGKDAALERLFDVCTESRTYEDYGNGLFWRKEKFYNGDYKWRFLHFVAGGEKAGERENTHVLSLIYRHRREGAKSETVFFPFVSVVQDGEDSRFSFLGRIFQRTVRNGKTGGYFLFIPYGDN